ncbi:hypothetical protein [Chachezhania sediminis]|uniref:hypothetical protein n=1 Tax=Chachezhania sediminis TaxID=2599291 RepID=UPI00131C17A5|nr:hypothetical protein [Chachezhania sediminis]
MRRFRTYLALSLAALLVLTGAGLAAARTAPDPAGRMVLCSGAGPVAVFVDADGNPVGPPHFCPDKALLLLAAVALPLLPELVHLSEETSERVAHVRMASRAVPHILPRGPPLPV